jgi:hypothetical protein
MAREIRISIDDDEVFERMKRRKSELGLTWHEVLQRGLSVGDTDDSRARRDTESAYGRHSGRSRDPMDEIGDTIEREVKKRVYKSLSNSFDISPSDMDVPESSEPSDPFSDADDESMETLQSAEDGELVFPFLEDGLAYRIPLRINVEMETGGIDIEVVAVRQSKSVAEMNTFDRGARRQIAEALASGSAARLVLEPDVEEYQVTPKLHWSRADGAPIVTDVEIDQVIFDDEQ